MPFEYKKNDSREITQREEKLDIVRKTHSKNFREDSKNTEGIRIASGYSKSRYIKESSSKDDDIVSQDAALIANRIFKGSFAATSDLFLGLLDYFNYDDSSED